MGETEIIITKYRPIRKYSDSATYRRTLKLSVEQCFSTLGSPSDFRGVARLSTNLLKNDGIFKY